MRGISFARRLSAIGGPTRSAPASVERSRSGSVSMNHPVVLKDGTQARVSLLRKSDSEDLRQFYDNLSSYSYIKGERCSDRNPGVDHGARLHEIAMGTMDDPLARVIIVRADTDGASRIIGACMMDYRADRCHPHRIVVADAAKMKGVGVAMKMAQMQLAQAEGMVKMQGTCNGPDELEKVYLKACEGLGLSCERTPLQSWGSRFPEVYQLEVDLRPRQPPAPAT